MCSSTVRRVATSTVVCQSSLAFCATGVVTSGRDAVDTKRGLIFAMQQSSGLRVEVGGPSGVDTSRAWHDAARRGGSMDRGEYKCLPESPPRRSPIIAVDGAVWSGGEGGRNKYYASAVSRRERGTLAGQRGRRLDAAVSRCERRTRHGPRGEKKSSPELLPLLTQSRRAAAGTPVVANRSNGEVSPRDWSMPANA